MFLLLHASIVGTIPRLPLSPAQFVFRAYHKALRTLGSEYLATTYFGARIYCKPTDLIQRMILYFGVWEPDVSRTIQKNLAPGDVFVDVGANIGYNTLLASTCVGATGRVVSIEAVPRTFSLLQRNLSINTSSANVRAVNAAVSDQPGTLDLYEVNAANIGAATTLASRGGTLTASVNALPLDHILTPDEQSRVRLIKIDVEGGEPPILRRLLDQLSTYPATMDIVVEATPEDDPDAWRDVFDRLRGAGFTAWAIENEYELAWYLRWRSPSTLLRVEDMPTRQQDLLFTRRQR